MSAYFFISNNFMLILLDFPIGSWYHNGVKLTRTDAVKIRADGEQYLLIVHDIVLDNAGEYCFTAVGLSTTANVSVNGKLAVLLKVISNFILFLELR